MTIPSLFPAKRDAAGNSKGGVIVLQLRRTLADKAVPELADTALGDLVVTYIDGRDGRRVLDAFSVRAPAAPAVATPDPDVGAAWKGASASLRDAFTALGVLDVAPVAPAQVPVSPTPVSPSARKALWLVQFTAATRAWVAYQRANVAGTSTVPQFFMDTCRGLPPPSDGLGIYEQRGVALAVAPAMCPLLSAAAHHLLATVPATAAAGEAWRQLLARELDVMAVWSKCMGA